MNMNAQWIPHSSKQKMVWKSSGMFNTVHIFTNFLFNQIIFILIIALTGLNSQNLWGFFYQENKHFAKNPMFSLFHLRI